MDQKDNNENKVWVAIDVAKDFHQVLISPENGKKRAFKIGNNLEDFSCGIADINLAGRILAERSYIGNA